MTNDEYTLLMPLMTLDSKLGEIPEGWLRHVEPHIIRGPYLPCWVWIGPCDGMGRPQYRDKLKARGFSMRRHIAALFWIVPEGIHIQMNCGIQNCVNPHHMTITRRTARHVAPKRRF